MPSMVLAFQQTKLLALFVKSWHTNLAVADDFHSVRINVYICNWYLFSEKVTFPQT